MCEWPSSTYSFRHANAGREESDCEDELTAEDVESFVRAILDATSWSCDPPVVLFDVPSGRLTRATLHVEKELKNQQGEGSSYQYKSSYTEQYLGDR